MKQMMDNLQYDLYHFQQVIEFLQVVKDKEVHFDLLGEVKMVMFQLNFLIIDELFVKHTNLHSK